MKGNPEDLYHLGEDLRGVIHRHEDAVKNNPDIAKDIISARDKAIERYRQVTEGRDVPEHPTSD